MEETTTITEIQVNVKLHDKSEYIETSHYLSIETFFKKIFSQSRRPEFTATDAYKIKIGEEVAIDGIKYSISDIHVEYYTKNPLTVEPKSPVIIITVILNQK